MSAVEDAFALWLTEWGVEQYPEREREVARAAFEAGYQAAKNPPKSDKSHGELVMRHLERYGSITQEEAREYDVRRLSAVILDLKHSGILISDSFITENGKRVKQYTLADVSLLTERAERTVEEKTIGSETFYKVHLSLEGKEAVSDWCSTRTKGAIQAVKQMERLLAKGA